MCSTEYRDSNMAASENNNLMFDKLYYSIGQNLNQVFNKQVLNQTEQLPIAQQ